MAVRKGAFKGAFKGSEPRIEVSDWFPSTSIRYKFLHSSLAHLCHEMTTEIAPYLIWFLTQLIDATVSLKTGIEECHKFCFLWYIFLTNSDRKTSEKFHIYCFYCTLTSVACSKVHFITNNQNLWSFVSFLVFSEFWATWAQQMYVVTLLTFHEVILWTWTKLLNNGWYTSWANTIIFVFPLELPYVASVFQLQ